MCEKQSTTDSKLSFLGTMLKYKQDYGVIGVLQGILLIVIFSISIRICINPSFIFDRYSEYMRKKHAIELSERSEYDEKLKNSLPLYLYKYDADRVWVINYHNGTMDWQHGTMRFELCADGVSSIKHQYNDFNLTWLDLPYYLKEHEYFMGTIDELYAIDKLLSTQLKKNDVQFLACTIIKDSLNKPLGIFGVTYLENPDEEHIKKLHDYLLEDRVNVKILIQPNKLK